MLPHTRTHTHAHASIHARMKAEAAAKKAANPKKAAPQQVIHARTRARTFELLCGQPSEVFVNQ